MYFCWGLKVQRVTRILGHRRSSELDTGPPFDITLKDNRYDIKKTFDTIVVQSKYRFRSLCAQYGVFIIN